MSYVIFQRVARRLNLDVDGEDEAKRFVDEWTLAGCPLDDPRIARIEVRESVGSSPADPWPELSLQGSSCPTCNSPATTLDDSVVMSGDPPRYTSECADCGQRFWGPRP